MFLSRTNVDSKINIVKRTKYRFILPSSQSGTKHWSVYKEFNVHGTVHRYCILKHNQQDATLYDILYCCQCCTCFERFSVHHQELKNCVANDVQNWITLTCGYIIEDEGVSWPNSKHKTEGHKKAQILAEVALRSAYGNDWVNPEPSVYNNVGKNDKEYSFCCG
jgi:hypothetical protein